VRHSRSSSLFGVHLGSIKNSLGYSSAVLVAIRAALFQSVTKWCYPVTKSQERPATTFRPSLFLIAVLRTGSIAEQLLEKTLEIANQVIEPQRASAETCYCTLYMPSQRLSALLQYCLGRRRMDIVESGHSHTYSTQARLFKQRYRCAEKSAGPHCGEGATQWQGGTEAKVASRKSATFTITPSTTSAENTFDGHQNPHLSPSLSRS
jgi:hypothetical protein